jgi:hypothetical protein
LLRRGLLQSARSQPAGSGDGHCFHLIQIDVQSGTRFAEGPLDDNFSPTPGQLRDPVQILGSQLPRTHGMPILEVRELSRSEFPLPILPTFLCHAKQVLHSS